MQADNAVSSSGDSSPSNIKKSARIFNLLTKRPSKVEPQPQTPTHHTKPNSPANSAKSKLANSTPNRTHDVSFAKCSPERFQAAAVTINSSQLSGQSTQSDTNINCITGLLDIHQRKLKPLKTKLHTHRHSSADAGSQSDGGIATHLKVNEAGNEVVLRKPAKYRSPSHNRFSHQFSLCCKAENKPTTPPVTVRYNSIPDAVGSNSIRRDNLSLNLSLADNASLSTNSNEEQQQQSNAQSLCKRLIETSMSVCASAPQSPVTAKVLFPSINNEQSSPSSSSLKSTQSGELNVANSNNSGPIRPIAVSACRSRLRLKLYPPGKEVLNAAAKDSIRRATTPQHMSSPNIAAQKDYFEENSLINDHENVRFMSHENIRQSTTHSGTGGGGLARQALMAAQVLSLIPTASVRERSLLGDGRFDSCTLLGPTELNRVLPTRQVTIFVGTWNMNGQSPPKQMNDFVLPTTIENIPDIVAIGTQESSPDRFEWEVTLQETLGPHHVLFYAATLGTLHLAIFMRRDLIWYCSAPEDASLSVRTGSAFRTKGAVAISFCLFGTSMLFVTSHLTAHQQKVKERVSDVKRITHALDLPKNLKLRHKNKDVTQNFDVVFWCGDLNFRLGEPREKLLEWIQHTKFPLPSHLPHGYMHTDQLSSVLSDGAAFRGFMEANITFPPTYKYDPGTQHFDTSSKQRAPAYTDRILYKYRQTQGIAMRRQSKLPIPLLPSVSGNDSNDSNYGGSLKQACVECLLYDSVPSIITSDHKPVWALFNALIRAGSDSIPLAAGLFNRDIYLEGMRRRLNKQNSGSSAVCIIQ